MKKVGNIQHFDDLNERIKNLKKGQNILFVKERMRKGFTQVPNEILDNPKLRMGAKVVYIKLLSYAWNKNSCFPGQNRMGRDLGKSRQTIASYLKELREHKKIYWKRRGLTKSNLYFIL